MKSTGTCLLALGCLALGCAGSAALDEAAPIAGRPLALAAPVLADTGYITAPALVSAGKTGILATVPVRTGATYLWTCANGTITGPSVNAALTFTAPAAPGLVTPACTVTAGGVATTYSQGIPVVPPLTPTPAFYGSGWSADSLANTIVGGPSGNQVSYRFQARYSQALEAVRVFFIWSNTKAGYASGGGGTVRVDVMADDGTASHLPTGIPLASASYGAVILQNNFYPRIAFPLPAVLRGGAFYHLVFTDVDPDPANNWVSLDTLWTDAATAPMQAVLPDAAFAVLFKPAGGAWRLRPNYTPTVELDFTSASQGNGYMEVWSANPKPISGTAAVREAFKVSGPSRIFSRVQVRLRRLAGQGPLTVRVEEADGTLVEEVQVAAASVLPGVSTWVTVPFAQSHVLNSGVAYNLVLRAPAGTTYSAFPIRKGRDKGFSPTTFFPDGHAQFTSSAPTGWAGWDMWGTPNLTTSDLQFAFVP